MSVRFQKLAVLGHPIAQSKSPYIHTSWMRDYDLQGSYEAIDIAPECYEARVRELIEQGYTGFNVTVPFKERVLKLCDVLDPAAEALGAVNTVRVDEAGKVYGLNTDTFGVIENLKEQMPQDLKEAWSWCDKTFVVLGAGGAARAAVYALLQEGAGRVIVCNRSFDKAQALLEFDESRVQAVRWEERSAILEHCDVLINTTSLGMMGMPGLEISLQALPQEAIVYDIVYKPLMTELLVQAQERGAHVVTGLGMLVQQARPAFREWFGVLPEVKPVLMEALLS